MCIITLHYTVYCTLFDVYISILENEICCIRYALLHGICTVDKHRTENVSHQKRRIVRNQEHSGSLRYYHHHRRTIRHRRPLCVAPVSCTQDLTISPSHVIDRAPATDDFMDPMARQRLRHRAWGAPSGRVEDLRLLRLLIFHIKMKCEHWKVGWNRIDVKTYFISNMDVEKLDSLNEVRERTSRWW